MFLKAVFRTRICYILTFEYGSVSVIIVRIRVLSHTVQYSTLEVELTMLAKQNFHKEGWIFTALCDLYIPFLSLTTMVIHLRVRNKQKNLEKRVFCHLQLRPTKKSRVRIRTETLRIRNAVKKLRISALPYSESCNWRSHLLVGGESKGSPKKALPDPQPDASGSGTLLLTILLVGGEWWGRQELRLLPPPHWGGLHLSSPGPQN